jgi:hypothetical protein
MMECQGCEMREKCIPVPGMPGQCTMPVECDRCINDRMDAVEHEEALLDVDIAAMQDEIADLEAEMKRQDGILAAIERQTREIDGVKRHVDGVLAESAPVLTRALTSLETSTTMQSDIKNLIELARRIKAAIL